MRPTKDSATRRGSERGLAAAAKKEHAPHVVRLPPLRGPAVPHDRPRGTRSARQSVIAIRFFSREDEIRLATVATAIEAKITPSETQLLMSGAHSIG